MSLNQALWKSLTESYQAIEDSVGFLVTQEKNETEYYDHWMDAEE